MVDRPNFDIEAVEKRNLALISQRFRTILLRLDFFVADDWTYAHTRISSHAGLSPPCLTRSVKPSRGGPS